MVSLQPLLPSPSSKNPTTEMFESFFQSLHTVHLHGAFAPWNSTIYHGLVELYITMQAGGGFRPWFPTQSQFAEVLKSCPELRTLRLDGFGALPDREFTPGPISLKYLDVLSLQSANLSVSTSHKLILPLISCGSDSLDVALSLSHDPDSVAEIHSFFTRSNVTRLYAHMGAGEPQSYIPILLGQLPHVRTLALGYCKISRRALDDYIYTNGETADPWPRLENLYLVESPLDVERIQRLEALHPLRELKVFNPRLRKTPAELRSLQDRLSGRTPYVLCSDKFEDDPLKDWDFV
ncbi:hypothetical protein FRC12_007498 [Ceratobasidium sp. 428]|nr:hypothetical protein FRC12_007498 [Ceratobasidium sp. 428]